MTIDDLAAQVVHTRKALKEYGIDEPSDFLIGAIIIARQLDYIDESLIKIWKDLPSSP